MIRFDLINVIFKRFFRFVVKMCLKFLSKDAVSLERCFSCIMNCDKILADVSLKESVSSDRHSVSVLIGTSYFLICFDY